MTKDKKNRHLHSASLTVVITCQKLTPQVQIVSMAKFAIKSAPHPPSATVPMQLSRWFQNTDSNCGQSNLFESQFVGGTKVKVTD